MLGSKYEPAVFLHHFQKTIPKFTAPQDEVLLWLASAHAQAEMTLQRPATQADEAALLRSIQKRVLRFGCSTDRIQSRNSCLSDFTHQDWEKMRIFSLRSDPAGKSAQERSLFYSEAVNDFFEKTYAEETHAPSVIVHVSCTGYVSPSGAQRLVAAKNWGRQTEVIHAYHMGCYAALPAIRLARGFLNSGQSRIDLVHTELCTLHLNPTQHDVEQLVTQTLFADGLIRYRASAVAPESEGSFEVLATREEILPDTAKEMTWMASDRGMLMSLSRRIPEHIASALEGFLERLLEPARVPLDEIKRTAAFAVHPGGPRIIDYVKELLRISESQVDASNAILRGYGNMSSATLPHIWERILDDPEIPTGTPVVSLAFGPGLTMSGALLRKRSPAA